MSKRVMLPRFIASAGNSSSPSPQSWHDLPFGYCKLRSSRSTGTPPLHHSTTPFPDFGHWTLDIGLPASFASVDTAAHGWYGASPLSRMDYKNTLNLPQTGFPMKADLVAREPQRLEKWQTNRLYEKIQAARATADRFVLHDGPPFANGDVHIGTALNKILKDLVVKYH